MDGACVEMWKLSEFPEKMGGDGPNSTETQISSLTPENAGMQIFVGTLNLNVEVDQTSEAIGEARCLRSKPVIVGDTNKIDLCIEISLIILYGTKNRMVETEGTHLPQELSPFH